MKKIALILIPLSLIVAIPLIMGRVNVGSNDKLEEGKVYEIWIQRAEVAPSNHRGKSWDMGGDAPDLQAQMAWQDRVVLTTVVSIDNLIAEWDQTAVEASQLIKGELDARSLQKVGRFRMNQGQFIEIGIFEDDILAREFVKALRVPMTSLHLGKNVWQSSGVLKNLTVFVQTTGENAKASDGQTRWGSAVMELDTIPSSMKGKKDFLFHEWTPEIEKELERATKYAIELRKAAEESGEVFQEELEELMQESE